MSGIDLALVDGNGLINWRVASQRGCVFAYLNATPGNSVWSQANIADDEGIIVGPYIFPTINPSQDPKKQMELAWRAVEAHGHEDTDMPVCLDIELPHGFAGTGMERWRVAGWIIRAYERLIQLCGYHPAIYSSWRVLDTDDTDSFAGTLNRLAELQAPLWLAQYRLPQPKVPTAWGDGNYWIHQDRGDVKGLCGLHQADDDVFNYCRQGAAGEKVRWVQQRVGAEIDGSFGPATASAVKSFQRSRGLDTDGIVGPRTWAQLAKVVP